MSFRCALLALFCLVATTSAAFAQEWRVQSAEGSASLYAHSESRAGQTGATLGANVIVETAADGRMRIARDADRLDLAPDTSLKIEGESADDTTVREFRGVLGVFAAAGSANKRFVVMTTHAALIAHGAIFGMAADARGTTIFVREGLASVIDLATHQTDELRTGQMMRILPGETGTLLSAADGDSASVAARDAATRASREARWDDIFKSTEVEGGEVRLKPIHDVVLGLSGAESYEFWTLALLGCLILGVLTSALLKQGGAAIAVNAVLAMLAVAAAVLVRDAFFRASSFLAAEPFLSIGMMLAAMLLLAGALAKMRLDL